jgi:nucleotide-binding universal stress UspA family protein
MEHIRANGKIACMLVAVDGSRSARRAFTAALDLAASFLQMPLIHVVYVVDHHSAPAGLAKSPPGAPDLLADDAATELTVVEEIARERSMVIDTHVLYGHPAEQILDYAQRVGADLIVAGTRGRTGLARVLLGSTCEALIQKSRIPIMTIHTPDSGS